VLLPMTKVRILGRRADAEPVLAELHELGLVEIADARDPSALEELDGLHGLDGESARSDRCTELGSLLAKSETLLAELGAEAHVAGRVPAMTVPLDLTMVRAELDHVTAGVEGIDRRLDALHDERLILPGYVEPLRRLLPLVPVLANLDVKALARLGLATVALVLNTDDDQLSEALSQELAEELGNRFELASTPIEDGAMGCLVVLPRAATDTVRAMLGRAAVRSVELPERFAGLSLHETVDAMQRRLQDIEEDVSAAERERQSVLKPHAERLAALHSGLTTELELLRAAGSLAATERVFVADCWVPRAQLRQLRRELNSRLGPTVVLEDKASSPYDPAAPVLMHNDAFARPFESLVRFLGLPRAGSLDPTLVTALFLPLMFGAMVGDIGYGAALLALGIFARRKLAARAVRTPEVRALVRVLLLGAAWSVVFGLLYGEFFGDLGQRVIGDFALWRYRPSAEALEPLLLFSVAVGAVHVVLGLAMGAWQAAHFREPRVLLDKLGTLLALAGLFGLAGWAVDHLPTGALTPSVAAVLVGLVLVMSLHGALGIVTGALDLMGRIGNILSYLRLAAVGLASAHLAGVANQLGEVGPIWLGVVVAAFFHALNLALASFSPMIQSLRLHYVEFFGVFFVTGGRAFNPFGGSPGREIAPTT
jgi:V/A-type H+/Na+-transporting ATPase subunit I